MISPTHIYPGPVGVDIKCSMSLLQLDIPADAVADRRIRRLLIEAIGRRIPTGAGKGQRSARDARVVGPEVGWMAVVEGASPGVCSALGIPEHWAVRCEDAFNLGHDETADALGNRLDRLLAADAIGDFEDKVRQLGSYGGGNHFGECEVVSVSDNESARATAAAFGLRDGHVAFL
jgi:tRNA-splicing ligase RtcB